MKLTRDEQIVRAAKFRELIFKHIVAATTPMTRYDLLSALMIDMDSMGYKEASLDNCLSMLTKAGIIERGANAEGKSVYTKAVNALSDVVTPKVIKLKQDKPTIVVDIIKNTGRVRLTLNGLLIEIGIV